MTDDWDDCILEDFDIDDDNLGQPVPRRPKEREKPTEDEIKARAIRSKQRSVMRRALSEQHMNEVLDWHLEDGCAYHCISGELHGVAVTSSANVNTNPRIEQAVITVDREVADFYRGFFDSLKPKNPWPVPWEPWEAERCPR